MANWTLDSGRIRSAMRASGMLATAAFLGVCLAAPQNSRAQQQGQGQPQGQQAKPQGKSSSWFKLCDSTKGENPRNICLTHHERIDSNTGMVLVSVAVRKIEGQEKENLMVMVPLGMAIPPGLQIRVDEQKPIPLNYSFCYAQGCTAEAEATDEIVQKLKKGEKLVVAAINLKGRPVGFPVPLNGFTKAYEGEPVDKEKYNAARKQLMEKIRRRQQELAKKAAEDAANKQGAQGSAGQQPQPPQ